MKKFFYRKTGFTLIEMLVVIAVIAILVTLGANSFTAAQRKSRDAKRKNDIRDIRGALEQYYSVCGYQYPLPTDGFYQSVVCTNPSVAMLPTVPSDPKGTTPYYCPTPATDCTASNYTICAGLEADSSNTFCMSSQQ